MHIVFAASLVPDGEPSSGYEIANRAILDALRETGVKLTIIGFVGPGKHPEFPESSVVLGEIDVRTDNASLTTKVAWLAKAVAGGLPFSSGKLRIIPVTRLQQELDAIEPFDAFVLNGTTLAGAFEQELTRKPFAFVAHNVEHRSAEENAANARSAIERLLFRREARLLKALETRLCQKAAFVFTLAEEDRAALGVDGTRSAVLPLTTVRRLEPSRTARKIGFDFGMIGSWTWAPNRAGLDWFLRQVAPLLPGSLDIRIAGAIPSGLAVSDPRIKLLGRVPDAAAFIRSSAVVPLATTAGTGVQLKTIETFEHGLPSVATSSAVRGISAVPANCRIADDPQAFADALMDTLSRVEDGTLPDLDGRAFHERQRTGMSQAMRLGLERLQCRIK